MSKTDAFDPRLAAEPAQPAADMIEEQPVVGRPPGHGGTVAAVVGFTLAAGGLFMMLNSHREQLEAIPLTTPAAAATVPASMPPPPPPLRLPTPPEPAVTLTLPSPASAPPVVVQAPANVPVIRATPPVDAADTQQRLHAPAVIVDLDSGPQDATKLLIATQPVVGGATVSAPAGTGVLGAGPGGLATAPGSTGAINDDQFATKANAEPERVKATALHGLNTLIPQGTILPAVLETAIDSDLPGYTRAVVSRDVLSFDGRAVLIPRGSRVIGEYKSAVALGASRAFVIWTRVLRPDGVSIQIGSPGTDTLGRAGLDGSVDRHFFTRFGGSILLSVLNAGVASVSRTPTTTISVGSPGAALGAAGAISPDAIAPTIKVAQGAGVNIFVARDLDFSDVGPAQ
jgi:type IV secretion system protein VirB10